MHKSMPYELRWDNLRLLYDDKLLDRNTAARELRKAGRGSRGKVILYL